MAGFDNGGATPGGASYTAPLLNFQQFSNWAADDPYQKVFNDQQQQLNAQRIQQGQTALDLTKTFQGGLPRDKDGNIDYKTAVAMLAQKGDIGALWNGADAMLSQSATNMSPMLAGGPQSAPGGPQGGPPQPASVQAKPLPAPAANSPRGDAGTGTVASLVTAAMPNQDATTGQTIGKVAAALGVDPNAQLTPGQQRRAEGLVKRYASAGPAGDGASSLPPSANAVTPAPPASTAPANFADRFASAGPQSAQPAPGPGGAPGAPQQPPGAPQPQQMQPQPGGAPGMPQPPAAAQPAPPPQGPITPQVPLPKGYTDPQQAILALKTEAARLSANPRAKGQVDALNDWAGRIEESIKPVPMRAGETLLDPRNGQPIYQGNQPTLSADAIHSAAERYLETGQLPPNTGRGVQGAATSSAIQNEAAQLAAQRGIDMATLPGKWQQFKAQQVAIQRFTSGPQGNTVRSFNVLVDHLDTLGDAASALKNGDIRFFNQWKQNFAAARGETAPTNFDGVKALVGDEIIKAVVGGAGALADREEVKKDLDRASSPKQLAELVDKYRKLALGQLKGLRKQYEVSTGQKNFGDLLLPGTLAALGGNEGKGTAPDKDGWVTLPNGARIQEVK